MPKPVRKSEEPREHRSEDRPPEKKRMFLTLEPERRISGWLMGVGPAKSTAQTVRRFQEAMLHGDEKHRYWAARLPQKDRDQLAGRVRLEAIIYIVIGCLLGGASFFNGVNDGLSGQVSGGLFWWVMGFLASVIGFWVGAVKFWQAHNVRMGTHIGLLDFLTRRTDPEGPLGGR